MCISAAWRIGWRRRSSHERSSGGFRGVGAGVHFPWRPSEKIQGLPILKIVRTADSTIIIITNFYLAASSHEIFLWVGGREGMKGLGALQRHQLPHPPCKNPGSATGTKSTQGLKNSEISKHVHVCQTYRKISILLIKT